MLPSLGHPAFTLILRLRQMCKINVKKQSCSSLNDHNFCSSSVDDLITLHTVPWDGMGTDDCGICLCDQDNTSLSLAQCRHTYHRACLVALINNSGKSFIECPTCKKVYGVKTGTMPSSGWISHTLSPRPLPGYEACGTIEITFNFRPGIQVRTERVRTFVTLLFTGT